MKAIVDTSTLISLARIGELHRLVKMGKELIAPEVVYHEAVVEGEKRGIRVRAMRKNKELVRTNILMDRELLDEIEKFAKERLEDRSTAIRQLIKKALHDQRIELGVKRFREGASFRKAAAIASLDYWDFQAELDKRGIPIMHSISLAKRRIEAGS